MKAQPSKFIPAAVAEVREWLRRYGRYAGLRYAVRLGVPFSISYRAVVGKRPRRIFN